MRSRLARAGGHAGVLLPAEYGFANAVRGCRATERTNEADMDRLIAALSAKRLTGAGARPAPAGSKPVLPAGEVTHG